MLNSSHTMTIPPARARRAAAQDQRGVVLIIALVVLVAMTLAALALVRSVDTNNLIAGNLAFQQSAVQAADQGIEDAANWLQTQSTALAQGAPNAVSLDQSLLFYRANGSAQGPAGTETWEHYWDKNLAGTTSIFSLPTNAATGNTVSYVIDRLCANAGLATASNCAASQVVGTANGNGLDVGGGQVNATSSVYYRITVRVDGPRNTVSFVQSVISM